MKVPRIIGPVAGGLCGLAVLLTLSSALPAFAHDDGHSDPATAATATPTAPAVPGITPEPEAEEPLVVTEELLAEAEAELDPAGTAATYVCGDEGADSFTVVAIKAADARAKADPHAQAARPDDVAPIDPCAGMQYIVGEQGR